MPSLSKTAFLSGLCVMAFLPLRRSSPLYNRKSNHNV
jgi:hypothetical protein